jgi:hypothetical protein
MVAFAAALAVWAIATPAFAAAPLCDPRGATGIAPAPQLQQPETSIDVGQAADECDVFVVGTESVDHGRAPQPVPPGAEMDPSVAGIVAAVAPAVSVESFARDGTPGSARAGARSRVDRPPRLIPA